GPHVPDRMDGFFEAFPFIDIAAHGEGEVTFSELLSEYVGEPQVPRRRRLSMRRRLRSDRESRISTRFPRRTPAVCSMTSSTTATTFTRYGKPTVAVRTHARSAIGD